MPPPETVLDVRCPRCGGRATFEEPFEFRTTPDADAAESRPVHRWGGWYVREKFPSVIRWKAPRGPSQFLQTGGTPGNSGAYRLRHRGVVRCRECHHVGAHVLCWARDAYFAWDIRGVRLWAWNADHARALLHHVESTRRDPSRYPPAYRRMMIELPAAVLAARNRALVSRKIRHSLRAAGESADTSVYEPPGTTHERIPE